MTCNSCIGSKAPGIWGMMLCRENLRMAYNFVKYVLPASGVYIGYMFGFGSKTTCSPYSPFAFSSDAPGYNMNIVETSIKMTGTSENDLMVASPLGSKIFAKGGLNYVIGGDGEDQFFYSLCSTDIIDKKIGVIQDFDISIDKIVFFCTNKTILSKEISIIHDIVDDTEITYIEVIGANKTSAVALLGDIPLQPEDIILNQKWVA